MNDFMFDFRMILSHVVTTQNEIPSFKVPSPSPTGKVMRGVGHCLSVN